MCVRVWVWVHVIVYLYASIGIHTLIHRNWIVWTKNRESHPFKCTAKLHTKTFRLFLLFDKTNRERQRKNSIGDICAPKPAINRHHQWNIEVTSWPYAYTEIFFSFEFFFSVRIFFGLIIFGSYTILFLYLFSPIFRPDFIFGSHVLYTFFFPSNQRVKNWNANIVQF